MGKLIISLLCISIARLAFGSELAADFVHHPVELEDEANIVVRTFDYLGFRTVGHECYKDCLLETASPGNDEASSKRKRRRLYQHQNGRRMQIIRCGNHVFAKEIERRWRTSRCRRSERQPHEREG